MFACIFGGLQLCDMAPEPPNLSMVSVVEPSYAGNGKTELTFDPPAGISRLPLPQAEEQKEQLPQSEADPAPPGSARGIRLPLPQAEEKKEHLPQSEADPAPSGSARGIRLPLPQVEEQKEHLPQSKADPAPTGSTHGIMLPLPQVEEENEHWPLNDAKPASTGQASGKRQPAEPLGQEDSPNPDSNASSTTSTSLRSASSRFPSSSSRSTRSTRSGSGVGEERPHIVCPAIKWRVTIDKSESKLPMGLDLADFPGALKVVQVHSPGLVSRWNAAHKAKEIRGGDYIVEINGIHGSSDHLCEVLSHDLLLEIKVLRGVDG